MRYIIETYRNEFPQRGNMRQFVMKHHQMHVIEKSVGFGVVVCPVVCICAM